MEAGVTTLLVVAFMGVFTMIMAALVGYVLEQGRYGRALHAREEALSIAESGLEYFKWHVAHNEEIREDGTGLQSSYTYTVDDPEGGELGTANITTSANMQCGRVQWIDVESEGTSNSDVRFTRTLAARYMRPSVGEYAFVTDSGVHYVSNVTGPVHGNSGVRMDGTNNSVVSSKLGEDEFWCTSGYNCNPAQWVDGVFGNGSNDDLWSFPVSEINFATMLADTAPLQGYASADGLYLSPTQVYLNGVAQGSAFSSVGGSESRGFHVVFNSNGTVTVRRVTSTNSFSSVYDPQTGNYITDYPDVANETTVGTYTLPSDCGLIYSEAKTWISGTVSGKITIVAADPGSFNPDIILGGTINVSEGNISYATTDGTTGLTAIAEHAVRFANRVPNDMSIRGIFVAQSGFYGRYFYAFANPSTSYNLRNSLTLNGSIVSKLRAGTAYGTASGFQNRYTIYDRLQAFDPSAFTPSARVDYGYVLWREE
jgi:hypothetical protein